MIEQNRTEAMVLKTKKIEKQLWFCFLEQEEQHEQEKAFNSYLSSGCQLHQGTVQGHI